MPTENFILPGILGVCMLLILFLFGPRKVLSTGAYIRWFILFWGAEFILAAMIVSLLFPGMVK